VSSQARRQNAGVHTAAASLETVERALGDLRVAQQQQRGGRAGGAKAVDIKVPATDFDFASANAKFDKAALAPKVLESDEDTNPSDTERDGSKTGEKGKEKAKEKTTAYNPQKSFFDSLSSSAPGPTRGGGGGRRGDGAGGGGGPGGGRGGGPGRNRREEERERNVATFGEPGGVGLMGPGAYVGGWGGYGRRGGRPRRGQGVVHGPAVA
jgi:protein LSM14